MGGAGLRAGQWKPGRELGAGWTETVHLGSSGRALAAVKPFAPGLAGDKAFRQRIELRPDPGLDLESSSSWGSPTEACSPAEELDA